jgi:hypothetical protein
MTRPTIDVDELAATLKRMGVGYAEGNSMEGSLYMFEGPEEGMTADGPGIVAGDMADEGWRADYYDNACDISGPADVRDSFQMGYSAPLFEVSCWLYRVAVAYGMAPYLAPGKMLDAYALAAWRAPVAENWSP